MSAFGGKADTGRSAALGRDDRRFRATPCEQVVALKLY